MAEKLDLSKPHEKHITKNGTFYVQNGKRFGNNLVELVKPRSTAKKRPKASPQLKVPDKAPPIPEPVETPD